MEPEHIFYCMPAELIVKIYKRMDNIGDVKATFSTCRRAKAIFDEHAGAIAKSHLLRTLDASSIKLMAMAVASRDVDPTSQESIEQFFRSYIWRKGPLPSSYITMDMVITLPWFHKALDMLLNATWIGLWCEAFYFRESPTEKGRALRACLMIETAANLFYRAPGKDGAILFSAPHVEWVDKYWEVFSHVEIEGVLQMKEFYRQCIFTYIDLTTIGLNYNTAISGDGMIGYLVGLENLCKWHQRGLLAPPPLIRDYYVNFPCDPETTPPYSRHVETPLHDARRCLENKTKIQPRFQPDPYAIDEETWQQIRSEGLRKFLGCGGVEATELLACWDKRVLEKYGLLMKEHYSIS